MAAEVEVSPLRDPAAIRKFMFAGRATFTLVSTKTGARFTYCLRLGSKGDAYFVNVLTGPDNESDFELIGLVVMAGWHYRHVRRNSRIGEGAASVVAFKWFLDKLLNRSAVLEGQLEFWHEGKCGRCNRVLTVPESLESGFGPECREAMSPKCVTEQGRLFR